MTLQIGQWQIDIISGGEFLHDGGVLYGIVPKTIWEKFQPADSQNRVHLAMHCVLARRDDQVVLIDTGHGDKLSPLDRKSHGLLPGWPLREALTSRGLSTTDVTTVILSHLHWDHSGGATSRDGRDVVPTFPNATYYVNQREWEDATSGDLNVSGGYVEDDIRPLSDSRQLALVNHLDEIAPGIQVLHTGGHTRGHQAVLIQSEGQGLVFIGDIAPTAAHIRRMWCTSYDLDLPQTRKAKDELFAYAADNGYWVVWNHDLETPISQVNRHPRRDFVVRDQDC